MSIEFLFGVCGVMLGALGLGLRYLIHRDHVRERQERELERAARARLAVTVRTVGADENEILWTDPRTTTQHTRIGIGVKNLGERAAEETLVTVLVPRSLEFARWAGPNGEERPDGKLAAETNEMLSEGDGAARIPSMFGSSTWDRVGMRRHYEKFVQFPVELPSRESGLSQKTVPVRVRVQADELPDDIEECIVDHVVRVVRRV